MPCFGFVLKKGDNTAMFWLLLSSAYTESRPFLLLRLPQQQDGCGGTRNWERTQVRQLSLS